MSAQLLADESALVARAQAGSADAFGELAASYGPALERFAQRFTSDGDDAKDVSQEALLRAFRAMRTYRNDRPFSRWLFVIARNAALDSLRRRRRTSALPLDYDAIIEESPESVTVRAEEALRLRAALDELPARHRVALELYYDRGLRYREIAEVLEIPIGTVKTYISRGKQRLRDNIQLSETLLAA